MAAIVFGIGVIVLTFMTFLSYRDVRSIDSDQDYQPTFGGTHHLSSRWLWRTHRGPNLRWMLKRMPRELKMKLKRAVILSAVVLLFASFSASTQPISAGACVYLKQSQPFRFQGVLTHKVFPGPPNYQNVRKGDKPESAYILELAKPICVSGDEFVDPKQQIDRVQVFPELTDKEDQTLWNELRRLVSRFVVVEGSEPFGAHTGHHHAPLLLPITKITAASHRIPR